MRLTYLLAAGLLALNACKMTTKTLTTTAGGHTLHHNGAISPDGQWLVFDGRNDDTKIGETSTIGLVNTRTGEEKTIYRTENPSVFGPGVGAATFSPVEETVLFIHGAPDANEEKPYAMSRRTGVGIRTHQPFVPVHFDARDTKAPFTPGSLRGGTHSHCWNADGTLISFTYNDEAVDPDLRSVGVMFKAPGSLEVEPAPGNLPGTWYSAIVTEVVRHPLPGTDAINKAFDECWLGNTATIAFQGNVLKEDGTQITEVFLVDIDTAKILADPGAVGSAGERPKVPAGIQQRRLTRSKSGLSDTRHWLRSSPDGKFIYALAKDSQNLNQMIQIDAQTGEIKMLTANVFSIDYTFNVSPDGENIAFVGQNSVFLYEIKNNKTTRLYDGTGAGKIVGAPLFAPKEPTLFFNQYMAHGDQDEYLQIRSVSFKNHRN
jgi:hypothetical protein